MIILKNAAVSPYLKPCTVTIHTGEKVALLGASGAGKTTLMRLMCGWLTPTSGDVIAPPVGEFTGRLERVRVLQLPPMPPIRPWALAVRPAAGHARTADRSFRW